MAKPFSLARAFQRLAFVLLIGATCAAIYARVLVEQRAGFVVGTWALTSNATLTPQIQLGLDQETAANPNIIGQGLHVIAPRLNLDTTFVSGSGLRVDDDIRVASNIKPFVAAAALKLVEQEKLSLTMPIGPFLSSEMAAILDGKGNKSQTASLRDLLSHTSGIPDYSNSQIFQAIAYIPTAFGFARHWTAREQVWFALNLVRNDAVGTRFSYSDTNYLLASDMIAKAVKAPNAGVALRQILDWQAIGAPDTFWEGYEPTPLSTRIARHFRGGIEDTNLDVSFDQYGGGGLVMSLGDLARAHRAIVRGDVFSDKKLVSIMQQDGTAPGSEGYGLGLSRMNVAGVTCWGHGGRWGSVAFHCPSIDLTIARSTGQSNAGPDAGDPNGIEAAIVSLLK